MPPVAMLRKIPHRFVMQVNSDYKAFEMDLKRRLDCE